MDTDFLLIRKIKSGDGSAGDAFVRKYYSDILKFCSYHCTNRENAQDMTQETFVRFFSKLSNYQHQGKAKNYLYTIAGNLCIDANRKLKEWNLTQDKELSEIGKEDCKIQKTEDQMTLFWALNQLPDDLREVIILYYFQEFKIREIAALLRISTPLTKYRLKQGRQKLQEVIKKEAIDES